jgi:O-Antigen ligase
VRNAILNRLSQLRASEGMSAVGSYLVSLWTRPAPALAPYHQPVAPLRRAIKKTLAISFIILIGMFYGLFISVFPIFLYLYLAVPVGILVLLVIWALPENENIPIKSINWLFFAIVVTVCLWPNYIAIAIPGLPWITFTRLWSIPMALLFVISLSMSPPFRRDVGEWFQTSPWILRLLLIFVALNFLTIPLSFRPFGSFNRVIINQFEWTIVFFVACYLFRKQGKVMQWARLFCGLAMFLAFFSVVEYLNGQVPWANRIPSFFKIQSELVEAILIGGARSATGAYRVQSIFTTSLNFAEFLALSTPFVIHFMVTAKRQWVQAGFLLYLPFSFWVIFKTDSRLGIIGFFASIFVYLLIWGVKRWRRDSHGLIAPAVVIAYPVVISGFFALTLIWRRLEVMVWGGGPQQASNEARRLQWTGAIRELKEWPLGNGLGNAGELVGYLDAAGRLSLDSYFITILLDFGIFGAIAFFGMFLIAIFKAAKVGLETNDEETELLIPVGIMLMVFLIIKGVLSQEDNHTLVFVALGAAVALYHRAVFKSPVP